MHFQCLHSSGPRSILRILLQSLRAEQPISSQKPGALLDLKKFEPSVWQKEVYSQAFANWCFFLLDFMDSRLMMYCSGLSLPSSSLFKLFISYFKALHLELFQAKPVLERTPTPLSLQKETATGQGLPEEILQFAAVLGGQAGRFIPQRQVLMSKPFGPFQSKKKKNIPKNYQSWKIMHFLAFCTSSTLHGLCTSTFS